MQAGAVTAETGNSKSGKTAFVGILSKTHSDLGAALGRLHSRLQGYVPAFGALVLALALHGIAVALLNPSLAGTLAFFLYLLTFLIASWCGYAPGLLVTLLITCGMPYLFKAGFSIRNVDVGGVIIFLLLSLIVSGTAAARRRTESLLRRLNRELDERVAEQTRVLTHQLAELETLYSQLPVGLGFLDPELRFVRVNQKLASLNRVPVQVHTGRELEEIVNQELASVVEPVYRRVLTTGEAVLDEEIPVPASGTGEHQFWSVSCSPVITEGRLLGLQVVVQDVTERRQAEQALTESNVRLRRANEDLEQFAFSASHDLQEPLRTVAIYSQMLKKRFSGRLGEEGDVFIGYTVQGALRMEQLVRDLLAYTQATSDAAPVQPVSAKEALDQALVSLHVAIKDSDARVTASELPHVSMRRLHLVQLLQNLISNSIKYRKQEPLQIHISAGRDATGGWLFRIEDNGIGIDPQYHSQVFGVFKRLHRHEHYPGTGIGLAICRRIVEQYGGRIWVESTAGNGATFLFTAPAASDAALAAVSGDTLPA